MTGAPSRVPGGGIVGYTLTASNRGPNVGGAMAVRHTLSPLVSFVSASGSGWTCSHGSGVVTCSRPGPLAVGAAAPPLLINGRVTVASGTVTSSAQVAPDTGGVADPVTDDDVATVSTPVVPGTDLRITKAVTAAQPAGAGAPVSFGIQPRNAGPSAAANVVVSDTLPTGWSFVSATGTGWACSATGQDVRCTRASLAVGATDDITVVATAPATVAAAGSSFTNTAAIASDTPDGDASNDSGSVTLQVRPDGADLRLAKTKTPNPVALGSTMVSTITVSNVGPRTATGALRVVDRFSPGETTALVQPAGSGTYAVQRQAAPPAAGSATTWYAVVETGSRGPAIIHNHIPLDPVLPGGISLQKTGDRAVAEVGDTVRYTVTVQLTTGARPRQTTVVDRLPAGFTYVPGTAFVDGLRIADPVGSPGPVLAFNLGAMPAANRLVLQYRLRVGVGSQQGDGINRARAHACGVPSGCMGPDGRTPIGASVATNEARHQVRVSGGVFAAEACVLGKVFVDCNGNHVQDSDELGVPGVRLLLRDGTNLVSDSEGKYSLCGLPPRSHVLRIDPHTLPRGSRLTTSSNRNLGDAGSLWLDLKNGELHRADFIEGSCSNTVLDQVKARRAQGEVRAPETERAGQPALRFDSKAHGLDAQTSPPQGTDGANQRAPKPRATDGAPAKGAADRNEQHVPTPSLPMNRPPPAGRSTGQADDATTDGGRDAQR
mgnify:FL=1